MRILALLCVFLGLGQPAYTQLKSGPASDDMISYRIYPDGLAPYSVFSVEIHSDGVVRYHGFRDVFVRGNQTAKIPVSEFQSLLSEFHSQNFQGMKAEYSTENMPCIVVDAASSDLTLREAGKEKRVRDLGLAPIAFHKLAERVRIVSKVEKWLYINDAAVAIQVAQGYDIRISGEAMLYQAITHSDFKLVQRLIRAGVSIEKVSSDERFPPIFQAAGVGNVETLKLLVDAGAKVNIVGEFGSTPLHFAALSNRSNASAIRFLLAKGADVNARDVLGSSPLMDAVKWESLDNIEALLDSGADLNIKDEDGKNALALAKDVVDNAAPDKSCADPHDSAARLKNAKKIVALLTERMPAP